MILSGVAQPVFPLGDRGTPSPTVMIVAVRASDRLRAPLPYPVDHRQWRTAVVPVLSDERWAVNLPLNVALLMNGGLSSLVDQVGKALVESFVSAGWGPDPE